MACTLFPNPTPKFPTHTFQKITQYLAYQAESSSLFLDRTFRKQLNSQAVLCTFEKCYCVPFARSLLIAKDCYENNVSYYFYSRREHFPCSACVSSNGGKYIGMCMLADRSFFVADSFIRFCVNVRTDPVSSGN